MPGNLENVAAIQSKLDSCSKPMCWESFMDLMVRIVPLFPVFSAGPPPWVYEPNSSLGFSLLVGTKLHTDTSWHDHVQVWP